MGSTIKGVDVAVLVKKLKSFKFSDIKDPVARKSLLSGAARRVAFALEPTGDTTYPSYQSCCMASVMVTFYNFTLILKRFSQSLQTTVARIGSDL